eukprot:COSAG05_NODE_1064_length_5991_cov_12.180414_14_plen_67_part_00
MRALHGRWVVWFVCDVWDVGMRCSLHTRLPPPQYHGDDDGDSGSSEDEHAWSSGADVSHAANSSKV